MDNKYKIFSNENALELFTIFLRKKRELTRFKKEIKSQWNETLKEYIFDKAIRHDEILNPDKPEEPIRFFKICYEYGYDSDKDRYVEDRYFVDEHNIKLKTDYSIKFEHLSFFPFFLLTTLRDINREIHNKTSFWGKIKECIDCKEKEEDIKKLVGEIDRLLLDDNPTVQELINKLKELENNLNISSESLQLQAFSKRSWELLDDLNIYLKTSNSKLTLPISRHGMGTQNIAILLIFNAYIDILVPKLLENDQATSIIGIEEPEAHVHPQAQRAVFQQISNMNGQKILSTHSPFVIDQGSIYDYMVFKIEDGITKIEKIPTFKKSFEFRYGLPEQAYKSNKYLCENEEIQVKRYLQFRNSELFFSSLFVMFEGDSEKVFLERIFPYYTSKMPGQMGITMISCEGQTYSPFLKIAHSDAFNLKWIILSDAENDTKRKLKNSIENCGYIFKDVEDKIIYLPDENDFEKYYINYYGAEELKKIIFANYGNESFDDFKKELSKQLPIKGYPEKGSIDDFTEEELINVFIDRKGKIIFSEKLSNYVIENELNIPDKFKNLIDRAVEELKDE